MYETKCKVEDIYGKRQPWNIKSDKWMRSWQLELDKIWRDEIREGKYRRMDEMVDTSVYLL